MNKIFILRKCRLIVWILVNKSKCIFLKSEMNWNSHVIQFWSFSAPTLVSCWCKWVVSRLASRIWKNFIASYNWLQQNCSRKTGRHLLFRKCSSSFNHSFLVQLPVLYNHNNNRYTQKLRTFRNNKIIQSILNNKWNNVIKC